MPSKARKTAARAGQAPGRKAAKRKRGRPKVDNPMLNMTLRLPADLIAELDACGFLANLPKRPGMVRNIRHFFERGEVTEQELRTLHGVVTELARGRRERGRGD